MDNQIGLGRRRSSIREHGRRYELPTVRLSKQERRSRYWLTPFPRLDQGATSECVIYSCDNGLRANPIMNRGFGSAQRRTQIYKEVQKQDGIPGEDYHGSTVLGMMRWLKSQGLIAGYSWAMNVDALANHLLHVGPVWMGTTWKLDCFTPDRWGYIRFSGEDMGGHAWLADGIDLDKPDSLTGKPGLIRKLGSWGPKWGKGGRSLLTMSDVGDMIDDYGEAATPSEVRRV